MKPSEILKPGMVGINLKGRFDPMGTIDCLIQGDTLAAHAWCVLPNGKIATTGGKALILYDEVDPDKYLKGKTCFLLETVDPLSDQQLRIIQYAHESMKQSGLGRIYGIWKFPIIWMLDLIHGQATRTGPSPKVSRPTCPICSQAVAYCFWKAGVPIGRSVGKEDYTAVLPETILDEAQHTGFALANGWLDNRSKPCFMLRTVRDTPYQF